jgi:hypothetical protein
VEGAEPAGEVDGPGFRAILPRVKPLSRLKPASSRTTRLLLAGLAWSATGIGLLAAGVHWLLATPSPSAGAALAAAAVVGWAKARFVLRKRAEENAARILASEDGRCAGGAFSWQAWLFVVVMMAAGIALRHSAVSRFWLGFVYAAVGTALLLASGVSWRHWARLRASAIGGALP